MSIGKFCPLPLCTLIRNFRIYLYVVSLVVILSNWVCDNWVYRFPINPHKFLGWQLPLKMSLIIEMPGCVCVCVCVFWGGVCRHTKTVKTAKPSKPPNGCCHACFSRAVVCCQKKKPPKGLKTVKTAKRVQTLHPPGLHPTSQHSAISTSPSATATAQTNI